MVVEQLIGAVLLKVSGGKVTSDLSVHPADVMTYIPDGINMLMGTRVNEEYGIDPSVYPNGLFVQVYDDLVLQTNSRNLKYVEFPVRPLSVKGGKSVIAVGEMGGKPFTRIYHDEGTLGAFYWKTKTDVTTFDVEGGTAVFYNIPNSVENVYAKLIVHIDSIGFTDDIFVPSGMENQLIDIIYNMVMQQRVNPKDTIIDGKDNVA